MATHYNISMTKAYPGGCCQFHYWNRLSSNHAFNITQMKAHLAAGDRKTKVAARTQLGFNPVIDSWQRTSSPLQQAVHLLSGNDFTKLTQLMALTKEEWYRVLAAQASIMGGFLFMVDNTTGRGDVVTTDLNIRGFATWLSRRARTYGRVATVPDVTARKHLKCWIFSPHPMNIYSQSQTSPQSKIVIATAKMLQDTAARRLKGEL